jgi:hypothetical protein
MKPMTKGEPTKLRARTWDTMPVDEGVIAGQRGRATDAREVDSEGADKGSGAGSATTLLGGVATIEGAEANAEKDDGRIEDNDDTRSGSG